MVNYSLSCTAGFLNVNVLFSLKLFEMYCLKLYYRALFGKKLCLIILHIKAELVGSSF